LLDDCVILGGPVDYLTTPILGAWLDAVGRSVWPTGAVGWMPAANAELCNVMYDIKIL